MIFPKTHIHTMCSFQRISYFHFKVCFLFWCFGLTGLRGILVSILLHRFIESSAAGLQRYCAGAQRKWGTPTGPTLLLKTVSERGTVFMFVSPRANIIFLQNYTGQQGLKLALHWEKRLREDGKRGYVDTLFSSQMEVFHVVNTEMPTQQTMGAATLLLFMHISHVIIHRNRWRV